MCTGCIINDDNDQFDNGPLWGFDEMEEKATDTAGPPIQLHEVRGGYALLTDLPGLHEKDVKLEIEFGVLTITSENERESSEYQSLTTEDEPASSHRPAPFRRTYKLPADVDEDAISAKLEAGVLTVQLPRRTSRPEKRSIPIQGPTLSEPFLSRSSSRSSKASSGTIPAPTSEPLPTGTFTQSTK
jgi:HSP20 family protein